MIAITTFDIEATSLNASYGRVLCACFKFQDEKKIRTVEAFRKADEKAALLEIRDHLEDAQIIVTWYGKMYDIPMITARMMRHGIKPPALKMHIDLKFIHAHRCATQGHRLENVAKDLALKFQKYEVEAEAWQAATDGDRPSFNRIVKHCQQDVLITEEVLDRMKHLLVHVTR